MQAVIASRSKLTRLFISRRFVLLWAGQAISTLGDMIFATTLAIWIVADLAHGRPWAPLAVSGTFLAAALPNILVGPFAGVFVDRWDRRRTMLRMDAGRAVLIAALLPLPFLHGRPPAAVALAAMYVVAFLAGVCAQFFAPARKAAIGEVVPASLRPRASSLSHGTSSLAIIAGPPLAAALYFALGPGPALAINALSFLISYLAVRAVHLPPLVRAADHAARPGYWHELGEGLRYFRGHRLLRTVLVVSVLATLGIGALNALDIFFLTRNLHAPLRYYGILDAVFGGGVLAGALVTGLCMARWGLARTFRLSTLAMGALLLCYARLGSFAVAVPVVFLLGVLNVAINVTVTPLILNVTPRELVGRVFAIQGPAVSAASLLSMAGAGYLASVTLRRVHTSWLGMTWGPIDTIFGCCGLLVLAGGIVAAVQVRGEPPARTG